MSATWLTHARCTPESLSREWGYDSLTWLILWVLSANSFTHETRTRLCLSVITATWLLHTCDMSHSRSHSWAWLIHAWYISPALLTPWFRNDVNCTWTRKRDVFSHQKDVFAHERDLLHEVGCKELHTPYHTTLHIPHTLSHYITWLINRHS